MATQTGEHPAVKAARLYGIDISLLIENLRRTPTERLERLRQRLEFSEELKKAIPMDSESDNAVRCGPDPESGVAIPAWKDRTPDPAPEF